MVIRDSTHSESALTFTNYQPGYTFPVLESASGQVYLAHAAEEERSSVLRGIELSEGRTASLVMFDSDRNIKRIRDEGYAVYNRSPHTSTLGKTSSISVPVFSHGKVCAALTLTFFSSAMPIEKAISNFMADLKATGKAIGLALTKSTLVNGKVKL
jgi:IclR family mhp operon transcriptional activator